MDEEAYLTDFLSRSAAEALVSAFQSAIGVAEPAGTETQLAHVVLCLLQESTVGERISPEVNSKARAALARQILSFPVDARQAGSLGFKLAALVEPARQLAHDWGAARVSPLTFLATCLSAEVPLDETSARTREALRAAGLTVEALGARINPPDARRQDFTFKSLEFGTDITAMAQAGFWEACPLVGMEKELRTLVKLLGTDSACIVGEPGVGKSAFIQGFAWRIAMKDRTLIPESMDSWTVVMIESTDILQGMSAQGQLEGRIRDMISFFTRNPTVIPFFEEIHRLLDTEDSSAKVIATALKPPMANGLFRCVGCTTDKEYARYIAGDEAMSSRLQKVLLPEPDQVTARKIIGGTKANLLRGRARQLGVDISPEGISTAVSVTATYRRSDRLPRKAINLLRTVVSEKVYELEMAGGAAVTRVIDGADVARLFSEIYGIPVDALDADRPAYYRGLRTELERRVKGQSQAVGSVVSRLALQARGWVDQRRPRGRFLFLGPPGVGKTELALSLAAEVMRDRGSLIVLNMADFQGEGARNKFMGADPGYKGYGETPTIYSRVMMRPFSVVVLDEFEKSDPSLANPLLSVLDGWGEDSQGRQVDFSQCIFVMTSNALVGDPGGALTAELWQRLGRLDDVTDEQARLRDTVDEELRQLLAKLGGIWTLPLLDRIDRVCLFRPLDQTALLRILDTLIEARRIQATSPLPPELDDDGVRLGILAEATGGADSASARRLERELLRWLGLRADVVDNAGVAAGLDAGDV
jgi:ATP-dependent Clp protease ATP-binding subunit ClpA